MTEQEIITSIKELLFAKLDSKTIEHSYKFKNYRLSEFIIDHPSCFEKERFDVSITYLSEHLRAKRLFSNSSHEYEMFNVPIYRLKDDNLDDQIDCTTDFLSETLINYALRLGE